MRVNLSLVLMATSLLLVACEGASSKDILARGGVGDPSTDLPGNDGTGVQPSPSNNGETGNTFPEQPGPGQTPEQQTPIGEPPPEQQNPTPQEPVPPVPTLPPEAEHDPLYGFPKGDAQLDILCARGNQDQVSLRFCANPRPQIRSLVELQQLLGLAFQPGNNQNGQGGNPGFAITGNSSSLVAKFVNAINPRVVIFPPLRGNANPNYIAMGFARGEQFAELVAKDPVRNEFNFFLVGFEQACNANPGGCNLGELLTPAVESNWTSVTLYQDTDLRNTVLDCLHCHQPAGPGTRTLLRMQELNNPWTHWFRNNRASNVLITDFRAAHGNNETYGGIPGGAIANSDPADLEDSLGDEGFNNQPNQFRTGQIEQEVANNGTSQTWQQLYDAAAAGNFIPVPYFGIRVTDPAKLAAGTQIYRNVMAGNIPMTDMMDIRNLFLESALPAMSFRPREGATGLQILQQMCQRCHNPSLDQTISRALFDVTKLATMSRAEKDKAIQRLMLPITSKFKMPPERFGELSPEETQLAIEELRK